MMTRYMSWLGNGLKTFLGPILSRLGRRLGLPMLDYRTISVAPNGKILQRVFNEVSGVIIMVAMIALFFNCTVLLCRRYDVMT